MKQPTQSNNSMQTQLQNPKWPGWPLNLSDPPEHLKQSSPAKIFHENNNKIKVDSGILTKQCYLNAAIPLLTLALQFFIADQGPYCLTSEHYTDCGASYFNGLCTSSQLRSPVLICRLCIIANPCIHVSWHESKSKK